MSAETMAVARNIVNQLGDLWSSHIPSEKWVAVRQETNDRADEFVDALISTVASRDEFHTMDELYEYRMLYNALLFNEWAAHDTFPVVKSWVHSDGELCFGGGWFIVVAETSAGQISNHYKAEHWDLFTVTAGIPPEYDNHTPQIAAERMKELLRGHHE